MGTKAAKQPEKSCLYLGHNFFAIMLLACSRKCHVKKFGVGVWRGLLLQISIEINHRDTLKKIPFLLLLARVHSIISHF